MSDSPAETVHKVHWDRQYASGSVLPWETGRPSNELRRVLEAHAIGPSKALELGCGTGTNAIWLAERGFDVTAVDLSRVAIARARLKAAVGGVPVRFLAADLRDWEELGGPFRFFFDRGCYHAVRLYDLDGYLRTLEKLTLPGTWGLVLAGNAGEPEDDVGPPGVEEQNLRREFGPWFEIAALREFRFSAPRAGDRRYLAWSCLLQRR